MGLGFGVGLGLGVGLGRCVRCGQHRAQPREKGVHAGRGGAAVKQREVLQRAWLGLGLGLGLEVLG